MSTDAKAEERDRLDVTESGAILNERRSISGCGGKASDALPVRALSVYVSRDFGGRGLE
jgi:hypothetical protein